MTQTAPPPDLDGVREHRDRSGVYRLYVADVLIGQAARLHVKPPKGRRHWRWTATPTRAAFTLNRIGVAPPADPTLFLALPAVYVGRPDAIAALVEHLRASGAPAVDPLYGDPHAA